MTTITLPPELETAVAERAKRSGTTPELLALDSLRREFLPPVPPESEGTMADFFAGYIGVIDSGEIVPGGANMSEDTGRKFKEILLEKHRLGKL